MVTVTRGRPRLLGRALASVEAQDCANPVEHLIVLDDDEATLRALEAVPAAAARRTRRVQLERRPPSDDPGAPYPRIARLLNRGAELACGEWIAFLDDDNTYAREHLRTLIQLVGRTGARAVHSGRTMHWPDGSPYLEPLFPHAPSREEARRLYDLLCDRGVWLRGTNVLLDRADRRQTSYRNSTVMANDDPVMLVDQNVWLIERALLLALPVPTQFSPEDITAGTAPDDKMLEAFLRDGVPIATTGLPTVQYFLGGWSNPQNAQELPGGE